ncbi:MAG: glucuronate isomerase [Oscillospiraceae bacterium]
MGKALDYFCENGCKVSDHGFSRFAYIPGTKQAELLHVLGKAYHAHGVAMQLHLGPIRNQNPRLLAEVGPDAGGDSVGLTTDPFQLGAFLGDLARENSLPNTILYNLNPTDNAVLSTMAVNFAPKVQFGAAWWFNDTIRGMRRQIDELMENGLLAKSVGMLTDSRSFSSFPRHEYYRRILSPEARRVG